MQVVREELHNPVTGMTLREISDPAAGRSGELVWEASYPAHSAEPPPHLHPRQSERMEVVAGRLHSRVAGVMRILAPGEVLDIPAGTAHAMWTEDEPATTRWHTMPALRTREFMRRLYQLAAEGRTDARGVPNLLQVAVLFSEHADEIRLVRPPALVQRILFGALAPIGRMLRA